MDAIEFLKEKDRMHEMMKGNCEKCGLSYANNGMRANCIGLFGECPEKAVEIVERWAKEHPRKTRQSEFLKLFSNARIAADGCIGGFCPNDLDTTFDCPMNKAPYHTCCPECRRAYWRAEVPDNAD